MSRYVHQIPFAAQGDFVWNRNTVHDGVAVKPGERVNTAGFTPVRLRQMYDARIIVPAPFGEAEPPRYLENGRGKADQLAKEIAAEEGADAQSRPEAKPAAPVRAAGKKPVAAAGKGRTTGVGKLADKTPARRGRSAA